MNNTEKKSLPEVILDKVKQGEVKMKSKYYFILRTALIMAGAIVALTAALYFTSFVFFALQRSGLIFLPGFGLTGLKLLVGNLPWLIIIIVLIFIFLLELFVKKFKFIYRKPLLYSALIVIAFVGISGFVVKQTPLHRHFYKQVQSGHLPLVRPLYRGMGMMHPIDDFHPGVISEITDNGFVLIRYDGKALIVSTSTDTHFPFRDVLQIGSQVMVLGELEGESVSARGIRIIPDYNNDFFRPGKGRMMR